MKVLARFVTGIAILLFFSSLSLKSQLFPAYHADSIRMKVNEMNGPYYYPSLLKRYQRGDTTLGLYHHYLLYHGLPFQSQYNPYRSKTKEIRELIQEESYRKAVKLCQSVLAKNPVDLDANYYLYIALKKTGKEEEAKKLLIHYTSFMESLLSSGKGSSMQTAWHVNSVNDEYRVLSYLELEFREQKLQHDEQGNSYDYIEVKPSKLYKEKGVYFDITRAFNRLGNLLQHSE